MTSLRTDPSIQKSLFAEDGAIWIRCAEVEEGQRMIQLAIHSIENWSERWGHRISTLKINVMLFTKKRQQHILLFLKGNRLSIAKEYKFLGITFGSTLTWASHIRKVK